jgi:hypothetical protein
VKRLLLLVVLACSLAGCGGAEESSSDGPSRTIEEVTLEETTERTTEETTEEVTDDPVALDGPVVTEAAETFSEPALVPETPAPPSDITPEQAENRRILEERQATYDGTGPSPWVQGQVDWARSQGLLPTSNCHADRSACSGPGIQTEAEEMEAYYHAQQSREANNGQGEGANMCGIAPDATWYGQPC